MAYCRCCAVLCCTALTRLRQKLSAYDEDASLTVDYLLSLATCNGRVGATGMCLGGHLAYRCALDSRVKAAVCYFATDIHSKTLARGKNDDSLARTGDIKGELLMVGLALHCPTLRCECARNETGFKLTRGLSLLYRSSAKMIHMSRPRAGI
jgi:hypothetical protein